MAEYATLKKAADEIGRSYRTMHDYASAGHFRVFKIDGIDSACVDMVEVRAWVESVKRRKNKRGPRPGYGSFGPDAKFVDLSNVVIDPASVAQ